MMFTKHELETILFSLEGYIQGNDDDKLCDELVVICDKIIEELAPAVTITPQQLEGDISTVTDDDYADKVDTFVGNMVANDDNDTVYNTTLSEENKKEWLYNYTHDSEGC